MTSRKTAVYGVGAALLVTYFAAANIPTSDAVRPSDRGRPAAAATDSLAVEVRAQAARLHARMAEAPVPEITPRNPFSFAASPRPVRERVVHAAVADEPAVAALPAAPALMLMGIAEETTPAGPRRTAVIGGDGDTIYMVIEGQPVGDRYKVTRIGADAVELEDLLTKAYRRIALR